MADRELEYLKEQIKYETDVERFTALLAVAIGGGVLGLVLGTLTSLRVILAGVGVLSILTESFNKVVISPV
jgi:hypothetical protein